MNNARKLLSIREETKKFPEFVFNDRVAIMGTVCDEESIYTIMNVFVYTESDSKSSLNGVIEIYNADIATFKYSPGDLKAKGLVP